MAATFANLSEAQKRSFAADLAAAGLSIDNVPAQITADGTKHITDDPATSLFPAHTVTVTSLAHLKTLAGVPDTHFENGLSDSHVVYPEALPAARTRLLTAGHADLASESLTAEEKQTLNATKLAFVTGSTLKVPPDLVTLANRTHFPMIAPVAAAKDLSISGRTEISGLVVCATITIQPGGCIVVKKDASIKAQVITKL